MHYVVDSETMKKIEYEMIENCQMDAMLLMEHAALAVALRVEKRITKKEKEKILCVCGTGNNGGDGIAAARILSCRGYHTEVLLVGDREKITTQTKQQLLMAEKLGVHLLDSVSNMRNYEVIVDALFGIGFHGLPEGIYRKAIQIMNETKSFVISVDIPSGICADTGAKRGEAVLADETVTFGVTKLGLVLYPGTEYAGNVLIADMGFSRQIISKCCLESYTIFDKEDIPFYLPEREVYSNKGSYGKVLVIAGSKDAPGAAYLSASAAYHTGAGLVKVFAPEECTSMIHVKLPEALTVTYHLADFESKLRQEIDWSSVIVIGPGIGKSERSRCMLDMVLQCDNKPVVVDADAINILADILNNEKKMECEDRISRLTELLHKDMILTPHLKELSRLLNVSIEYIKDNMAVVAKRCSNSHSPIYIIKDTRTMILSDDKRAINVSGNNGMATGGSGDVLSGMIAGMLAGGMESNDAAAFAVYIHGLAGECAADEKGTYSMLAGDIIENIPKVIKNNGKGF